MNTTNNIEMKQTPFADFVAAMNEPHLPVVLLLDTSGSMNGKPLEELLEGYNRFLQQTMLDEQAKKRVDIAVLSFSGSGVKTIQDFIPLSKAIEMPPLNLKAEGNTPMGEAIEKGIQTLRDRSRVYAEAGVPNYKGWLFLLSDGEASDDISKAKELIRQREDAGRLKFFSVAVNKANIDVLKTLGPRVMQCTKDNEFKNIFDWLAASMTVISASRVSENPQLPNLPDNFKVVPSDW